MTHSEENDNNLSIRTLNRIIRLIKKEYEKRRKLRDPRHKGTSSKFDNCWPRIAKLILDIKADPILFIEAQFYLPYGNGPEGFPFPNQMYSDTAIAKYKDVLSRTESPFEQKFTNQIRYLKDLLSAHPERSMDEILLDKQMPLRSFIRVIMCSLDVYEEVDKMYGELAKKELQFDTGLSEYIKNNYGSRYKRIFRERFSERVDSKHSEDIGPPSEIKRGENYPKRCKRLNI